MLAARTFLAAALIAASFGEIRNSSNHKVQLHRLHRSQWNNIPILCKS